jgi:hypothetical protein
VFKWHSCFPRYVEAVYEVPENNNTFGTFVEMLSISLLVWTKIQFPSEQCSSKFMLSDKLMRHSVLTQFSTVHLL